MIIIVGWRELGRSNPENCSNKRGVLRSIERMQQAPSFFQGGPPAAQINAVNAIAAVDA
jgi:hypothetical protein